MPHLLTRRDFVSISVRGLAFGALASPLLASQNQRGFKISLNESSFHQSLKQKKIDHLDLAGIARKEFGIDAIEYVTSYFSEHAADEKYIKRMNRRAAEEGVRQILIVVNDAGEIADADAGMRKAAIKNHLPWIDLAKTLGCHSVCVKAAGEGTVPEQLKRSADSLAELAEYAKDRRIHVLACCNCSQSWKPETFLDLLKAVDSPNVGLYPSFSGFNTDDPYSALEQLMPFAKGVRANAKDFDEKGNETSIDFSRMVQIVLAPGYRGHVSIQYQGTKLDEINGVRATKALLDRALAAAGNQKE
jgi:sugar phosphate isomerase/epimerase